MYSKLIIAVFTILVLSSINQVQGQEEEKLVILETPSGKIVIEFFPEDAPNHVENFIKLAESGFYDRTIFHRIIKDFMIQGGDPKTKPGAYQDPNEWGTGDPGYSIDAEFNDIMHNRGIVSMARSTDPNSAGSQFFIVHKDSNFLDGQYTVFGRIATQESYDTLDKIATLETPPNVTIALEWGLAEITKVEIVNRSEVDDLLDQGEPERMSIPIPQFEEPYTNEKLGFSYVFPTGWTVQESDETNPNAPDITAVEPTTGGFPSYISISVIDDEGKSLEEKATEFKDRIQASIDSSQNTILLEEKTQINGLDAHQIILQTKFPTQSGIILINFDEFTIKNSGKFYVITYVDTYVNFKIKKIQFEESLSSFEITDSNQVPNESNSEEEKNGCLIATAVFGSELSPQVQKLREIRDNSLLKTESGTAFMTSFNEFYYSFSPTIADWERENLIFKETTKIVITPLLYTLSILNHVEINSEADMLAYGIGIISLNLGIYLVGPTVIILKIKPKNKQKFK